MSVSFIVARYIRLALYSTVFTFIYYLPEQLETVHFTHMVWLWVRYNCRVKLKLFPYRRTQIAVRNRSAL